ncbi:hypothetical protein [Spiroplasma endosymbiont of Polydrusus pterygomalis]
MTILTLTNNSIGNIGNPNIYFKWFLNHNGITALDVKLNNAIFFNSMN